MDPTPTTIMKIPEHLKDEELVYYYSIKTNDHYYTFIKNNKRSNSKVVLESLLKNYKTTAPQHTLPLEGRILLKAPLKDFLTLYPEHFL
jgi:hypothetical protein